MQGYEIVLEKDGWRRFLRIIIIIIGNSGTSFNPSRAQGLIPVNCGVPDNVFA